MTDWADDIQDYEYPDPDEFDDDEFDDDEAEETFPCPECHESIYIESVCCPNCGLFLTNQHRRSQDRSNSWRFWVIVVIILSLVATYLLA